MCNIVTTNESTCIVSFSSAFKIKFVLSLKIGIWIYNKYIKIKKYWYTTLCMLQLLSTNNQKNFAVKGMVKFLSANEGFFSLFSKL